ncbi:hypothetical protein VPEG_00014 [Vibrio phage SIO-2]|uniref:hypothetical protein n=1 Tax=Vibrio phage SIO-2 TaxID=700512 RepID=UPI0002357C34|nr:hypothetical protein VPEG_00014 [Vibrio phage SIO-2]AET42165.1 hypothetical protein VPEG_00014 [Vibrio phage SIO-2]
MYLSKLFNSQRSFSAKAFAGQTPLGVFKHLEKEAVELEEDPSDLLEWADCFILTIDGAMRSRPTVASPEWCAIRTTEAMREKSKLVTRVRSIESFKAYLNEFPSDDLDSPHAWTYLTAILVNLAGHYGISPQQLYNVVERKIDINKSRKWGAVDPNNPDQPIHHIEE